MTNATQQLIENLAQKIVPIRPMQPPYILALRLGVVLLAYGCIIGWVLGLRPDLMVQFHRPFYLAEIILLAAVTISSFFAAIYLAFPDQYQYPGVTLLPLYSFALFAVLLLVQAFLPPDARMVFPASEGMQGMECTFCVASVAIIPSALMFIFLRKGATSSPPASGAYSVLAAAGLGCFMLRLSEANDSLIHLVLWHYLPIVLFAILGAFIGKILLKW